MAGRLMRLLFRPGWRLRCIDPPLGWVRVSDDVLPVAGIRLLVTTFLTSQWAGAVTVKELQLRVMAGEREYVVPWIATADPDGVPLGDTPEYSVGSAAPHHAFVDVASDAPDLVVLLESATEAVPVQLEGIFNAGIEFRPIAGLDLTIEQPLLRGSEWRRVRTGRELTE